MTEDVRCVDCEYCIDQMTDYDGLDFEVEYFCQRRSVLVAVNPNVLRNCPYFVQFVEDI